MLKNLKTKKRRKGFTLIELVLVIAIIGILGAMVIPQFNSVAENAEEKANLASARTIESAINIVLLENDSPDTDSINKYLSNIKVTVCETENHVHEDDGWCVTFKENNDFEIRKDGNTISLASLEEENK